MIEVQTLTVFSTPACSQCTATKMWLEREGVPYEMRSVDECLETLKALGHFRAPIVIAPDQSHWSGYRPDKLEAYAQALKNT